MEDDTQRALVTAPHYPASTFNQLMSATELLLIVNRVNPVVTNGEIAGEIAFEPQMVLHMSPQAAKELAILLSGAIAAFEAEHGEVMTPFIRERTKA